MTLFRYLTLAVIALGASIGDVLLKHGMNQVGAISLSNWTSLIAAVFNPWVVGGILCLLVFFASYLSALSWADLTYVLPATAFGYVVVALLSVWTLGESVSPIRWVGILLITAGVGFVTTGPARTERIEAAEEVVPASRAAHEFAERSGERH